MLSDNCRHFGKAFDAGQGFCPLEIGAPAIAGDRGDVGDGPTFTQAGRHGFRQGAKPIEIDGERRDDAGAAGEAGDIGERVEARRKLRDDLGNAGCSRKIALDEGGTSSGRLAHIDADDLSAHLAGQFRRAGANAGSHAGHQDRFTKKHERHLSQQSPEASRLILPI